MRQCRLMQPNGRLYRLKHATLDAIIADAKHRAGPLNRRRKYRSNRGKWLVK